MANKFTEKQRVKVIANTYVVDPHTFQIGAEGTIYMAPYAGCACDNRYIVKVDIEMKGESKNILQACAEDDLELIQTQ